MKRVSQLTALALLCGLASLSCMAADMPHSLTLGSASGTARRGESIPDASAFYNNWPQTLSAPSGHEPLRLTSLPLAERAERRPDWPLGKTASLTPATTIALYGSDADNPGR
ncbi:hypothetical protein KIF59_00260 [Enterobacter cloacae subsp. cloacae]|nr:hypothetical protein [Enterobacter cloacae subsp. cloacae]